MDKAKTKIASLIVAVLLLGQIASLVVAAVLLGAVLPGHAQNRHSVTVVLAPGRNRHSTRLYSKW